MKLLRRSDDTDEDKVMAMNETLRSLTGRRLVVLSAAVVALLVILFGGAALPIQQAAPAEVRVAQIGRTNAVCTVAEPTADQPKSEGLITVVSGVTLRRDPVRPGSLVGTSLTGADEVLRVTAPGKGVRAQQIKGSVELSAEGSMASSSVGSVFSLGTSGVDNGLAAASCLAPGTTHWFSGLGASDTDRTELILTNADDSQAEVDLRFYGPRGRVVVAGSPGLVIDARSTRVLSLSSAVKVDGPLGMSVQASQGRVAVAAKRLLSAGEKPAGVDWLLPSAAPGLSRVIPAVPGEKGTRSLVLTNPGPERAKASIQILGLQGRYAPTGADTVEIPAEGSAAVDLEPGLAAQAGSISVTSDHPVTGTVVSASARGAASEDISFQSAANPIVGVGVAATANNSAADAELILSNPGNADSQVTFKVLSYNGVVLRTDQVLLTAGSTATRRVSAPAPSYVVVTVPDGSTVVGGMALSQSGGSAAGMATLLLTSPDVVAGTPRSVSDPTVGH